MRSNAGKAKQTKGCRLALSHFGWLETYGYCNLYSLLHISIVERIISLKKCRELSSRRITFRRKGRGQTDESCLTIFCFFENKQCVSHKQKPTYIQQTRGPETITNKTTVIGYKKVFFRSRLSRNC